MTHVRRLAVLGLGALAVASATAAAPVRAAEPAPETAVSLGAVPDRAGVIKLPASGFEVQVPKGHRAATEAYGRVVFRPDGPEVSDEIAVTAAEGALALSVIVGGASCEAFEALGSVEKGVRMGRATWSRLEQNLAPAPIQNGAEPPPPLKATVWCRPGVLVHTVAVVAHPGVALWLDALAKLRPPSARGLKPAADLSHVFVERPEVPDEVLVMPVRQRFVIEAFDSVWETDAPVGRVPKPAGAAAEDLATPASDRFEVLVPRAWLLRLEISRVEPTACVRLKRAPRGLPEAPAGFFWATSDTTRTRTTAPGALCQDRDSGPIARIALSAAVPMATAALAAMPILRELADLAASKTAPPIAPTLAPAP